MAKLEGVNKDVAEAMEKWHDERIRLYDAFTVAGLCVEVIEPGRTLCSFTVPPRLTNANKRMYGGAVASLVDLVGSAVFFAEAPQRQGSHWISPSLTSTPPVQTRDRDRGSGPRHRRQGGCVTVEVRRKGTGQVLAHGQHTKYLAAVSSKL
ncbi:hypothetical protein ZWY2020_029124 [Hordeum vulgare]|nr:hypothetical protein ZWY2020_029124 [Hordeum vulgare]